MNDNAAKKPFSIQKTVLRILLYFVVIDVCIITLYPYFAMFCTALKSRAEIFSPHGTILPVTALWSNFIDIWSRAPMANYLLNSILIAGGSTIIAMLCGIPAAYALARMRFKGQTAFLGFVIVSQMFAPVVLLIGIYQVMLRLGLTDSLLGLIFINAAFNQAFTIWLIEPGAPACGRPGHRDNADLYFYQRLERVHRGAVPHLHGHQQAPDRGHQHL